MSKKRAPDEEVKPAGEPVVDNFLTNMMTHAKDVFGSERGFIASDSAKFATGVPLKELSLMYLLGLNIFPLAKCVGIAGKAGSCKSALGFDFVRRLCEYNGYAAMLETEAGKVSEILVRSIIQDKYINAGRFSITPCTSIDEVQGALLKYTEGFKVNDPGASIPMEFLIDSLTGNDTDEAIEKLDKEGHTGRGFAISALSWSTYFKMFPQKLMGWPIGLIYINHMKESPPPPGQGHLPPKKRTPGGDSQWFHASIYIYTTVVKEGRAATRDVVNDTIDCPNEYRTIRLFTEKNSLAPGKKALMVDMVWYWDEEGKQHTYWDWETATAELVAKFQAGDSDTPVPVRKELREICDLTCTKGRYTSERLCLDDVNGVTIGNAIHNTPELMTQLVKFFHISTYPIVPCPPLNEHGIPIPKPVEKEKKVKKEKSERLTAPPLPPEVPAGPAL